MPARSRAASYPIPGSSPSSPSVARRASSIRTRSRPTCPKRSASGPTRSRRSGTSGTERPGTPSSRSWRGTGFCHTSSSSLGAPFGNGPGRRSIGNTDRPRPASQCAALRLPPVLASITRTWSISRARVGATPSRCSGCTSLTCPRCLDVTALLKTRFYPARQGGHPNAPEGASCTRIA